jgi:hypothetical protein
VLLLQIRPIIAATALAQLILVEVRSVAARADDYPEHGRPITMIVGYAPGGATDTGARLMAAALEPRLHTQVQVVNRPGAGSQVALTQLVRAKPDGYTLSYIVVPTVVTHYLDPTRGAIYTRASPADRAAFPVAGGARGAVRRTVSYTEGTGGGGRGTAWQDHSQ